MKMKFNDTDLSNITDHQLKIINKTAKTLAPFFVFSYYDKEDIEQEIRLICLKVIGEYDESKSDLYTFLFSIARNAMMDLRRSKFSRTINMCKHNDNGECIIHSTLEECNSVRSQYLLNMRKKNMAQPQTLTENSSFIKYNLGDDLDKKYIYSIIDREIPAKIRHDYLIYLEDGPLSYYKKLIVIETIRTIAQKYGFDKWVD